MPAITISTWEAARRMIILSLCARRVWVAQLRRLVVPVHFPVSGYCLKMAPPLDAWAVHGRRSLAAAAVLQLTHSQQRRQVEQHLARRSTAARRSRLIIIPLGQMYWGQRQLVRQI